MVRLFAALLILTAVTLPAAAKPDMQLLKKVCRHDYEAFCSHVFPGGGRIIACLRQHDAQLTKPCRAALAQ